MATAAEYVQSILTGLALVQSTEMDEETLLDVGVIDMLMQMNDLATELTEVLE